MPIGLARPSLLFGMCCLCLVVLFLNIQRAPAARLTDWRPSVAAAEAPAGPAAAAPAPLRANTRPLSGSPAPGMVASSVPLGMAGDVGFNVLSALDASSGALRHVTIQPGATWSFNATVGNPAQVQVRSVGGIPGGGWCDLASRYVQAARPLLPESAIRFPNHVASTGIGLSNVADADTVAIWNIDGLPGSDGGRGDLQITNTLASPLRFDVVDLPDGQIVVRALVAPA